MQNIQFIHRKMENKSATKTLSPSQMETLSALCNTFLPAINEPLPETTDASVTNFFQTSAASTGTPHQVAWLINERMKHPKLNSLLLMLWFLSTRIGTLLLCGKGSLSTQFPFLLRFPEISQNKRERIVQSWATSSLQFIRNFFTAMKALVLIVFFTAVDDKGDNPSWKGIGYCGPDPSISEKQKKQKHHDHEDDDIAVAGIEELLFGPLYNGIIDLNQPEEFVFNRLTKLGCSVTKPKPPGPSFVIECDAVVVGSGSGGGVISGVLANAGYKVLVLEKGNYYARTNLSLLEGPSMDKMFLGGGLLMTKDLDMVLLAGSTVGGGSTVNWSASIKTPPYVLQEWRELHGLELFGSEVYQKAMDIVCGKMGVQRECEDESFQNMVLRKGCQELGYPVENIPQNAQADHYCGWCTFGCKDGRKKGTAETWFVDLVKSGNGAILPECEALQVIHERNKAKGVVFTFQRDGVKQTAVIKSKVTVVACGALTTPSLLINSGLKNRNIGRNLRLHPVVFAWGYFPDAPGENKKSYEGAIMSAMSSVVLNVNGTGYGAVIQTPALHPGLFSALMPWNSGHEFKMRMSKYARTAHVFALARDMGSGEAFSPTSVTYDLDKTDEENLQRGIEKLLRILAAAGAEEMGCNHGTGRTLKVKEASKEEFERFVKEESSQGLSKHTNLKASAHQMGSCRMGVDPKTSVVNPKGETWEVEGLFVGDGSVLPTALGINPMVTIMSVSYCISHSVLDFLKTHD
nr:long-chain-alcohol oxidase FAO4A-like [Ipomoea batatas]